MSADMSLKAMCASTSAWYSAASTKFGCPGVKEQYLPPYSGISMSCSKAFSMKFSMLHRSAFVIAPGSGNAFRLRPTRTRIESSGSPSAAMSSTPPSGRPSTPSSDQSFACCASSLTLWYLASALLKKGLKRS